MLVENRDFFIPLASDITVRESPSEYCHAVWYGKLESCDYPIVKKLRICVTV